MINRGLFEVRYDNYQMNHEISYSDKKKVDFDSTQMESKLNYTSYKQKFNHFDLD